MRIKTKLVFLTAFCIGLYTISLLLIMVYLINTRFFMAEKDLAEKDMDRVVNAFQVQTENLRVIVTDYAFWDETWNYAMNRNPDYIQANLDDAACKNLKISLFAIYNQEGTQIGMKYYNAMGESASFSYLPEKITDSEILQTLIVQKSALVRFGEDIMILSSSSILPTANNGPVAGLMLMGKIVNDEIIQSICKQTRVDTKIVPEKRGDVVLVNGKYPHIQTGLFQDLGDSTMTGYISFVLKNDEPILLLQTKTPLELRAQGISLINLIISLFVVYAIVIILFMNFLFQYMISRPLSLLEKTLSHLTLNANFQLSGITSLFVREDELGNIARAIKEMKTRILIAHDEVQKNNERLSLLVESRTAILAQTNAKLEIFKKIMETTSEAVIITDLNGNIIEMNDATNLMTGYSREELLYKNPRIFKSFRHNTAYYKELWDSLYSDGFWQGEIWDRKKDGTIYPKWQTINVIKDSTGKPLNYVGVSSDISVLKESEEKLLHLAYYDPLTSLPNRTLFSDRLENKIALATRNDKLFGLLFIDLDRFKNVNDTLGHMMGDLLLIQVTQKISECIRSSDTLSRIGGDEFTLILDDIAEDENAGFVATQILHMLEQRFEIHGNDVYIGASIGIALFPKDGRDPETILRKADAAMYLAKEDGRGRARYASDDLEKETQRRHEIEAKMHTALERNEFRLFYQPQNYSAQAKAGLPIGLSGVETLIRWQHKPDEIIMPDDFLPVAEETGFIVSLGTWVLNEACRDAKRWFDMGKPLQVSVNVDTRQLNAKNFVETVFAALESSGLPPNLLKLEITESGFVKHIDQVIDIMKRIQAVGVSFAIDDFGTGFCSLQYLNRLPVDCLKIDQSFVRSMGESSSGGDIVSAVISMAHAFGLCSVAEGVETEAQLEQLCARGCDTIQGYLVSRPMPYDAFVQYLYQQ